MVWPYSSLIPTGERAYTYQAMNFVRDDVGGLYLIGTDNLSAKAPFEEDDDVAHLLEVTLTKETLSAQPKLGVPTITLLSEKRLGRNKPYANFKASAGVYVDNDSRSLFLYGGYYWRREGYRLHFAEFSPGVPADAPPLGPGEHGWVELFEEPGFRGRRLTIRANDPQASIVDYNKIRVKDEGFGDDLRSVRFQLPVGKTYRLFKHKDFKPKNNETIDLVGTEKVVEVPERTDEYNFDIGVSSSRMV